MPKDQVLAGDGKSEAVINRVADAGHDALEVDGILSHSRTWRERVLHGKKGERAPENLSVPKYGIASLFGTIGVL